MQTLDREQYIGVTCINCQLWQIATYRMGFGYTTICDFCETSHNEVNL